MEVAVIIPCYNVVAHVESCLESVFGQTHSSLNVICINDGSTDGTLKKLEELKQKFDFQLISVQNSGACKARNKGMNSVKGDYIQFLDADDVLDENKIETQLTLALESNADVVIGAYTNEYMDGRKEELTVLENDWEALIRTKMGTTSSNLWKREALIAVNGWDEKLESSQDYDLLFRLLKKNANVKFDPRSRAFILKREEGSISQTRTYENWKRYLLLREEIRAFLKIKNGFEYEIEVCNQYLFMAIRVLAQYDMNWAVKEHVRLIPNGFIPSASKAITARYIALYRIFGFASTERIVKVLKPGLYGKK